MQATTVVQKNYLFKNVGKNLFLALCNLNFSIHNKHNIILYSIAIYWDHMIIFTGDLSPFLNGAFGNLVSKLSKHRIANRTKCDTLLIYLQEVKSEFYCHYTKAVSRFSGYFWDSQKAESWTYNYIHTIHFHTSLFIRSLGKEIKPLWHRSTNK